MRDFDNNGTDDLVLVNTLSNSFTYWSGVGDGTLTDTSETHLYDYGGGAYSVATADFNGDGALDLAIAMEYETFILVFPGNGDGTFGDPLTFQVGAAPHFVVAADFNGDGKVDLAVANYFSDSISILFNNSN